MQRRQILRLAVVGLAAMSLTVVAQPEKRVRRIGYLSGSDVRTHASFLAAFRAGMADLRWVEGRDYVIDTRYANGVAQAGPGLAAELVATRPDLLLTSGDASIRLLAQRTKTIPIVFTIAQDPVGNGLAASLQRPGGNATGLTNVNHDLGPKRLQLLKEAFPRVVQVVVLFEPTFSAGLSELKAIEEAAPRLGMHVTPIGIQKAGDIEAAFKRGAAVGADAYMVTQSALFNAQRQAIVDRIYRSKAPTIWAFLQGPEAGGLMSYGSSNTDNFRRAAAFVDKILKGTKPGELPIEQPTKFELIVNLKTAKAMGITFPKSFLVRADRMIE